MEDKLEHGYNFEDTVSKRSSNVFGSLANAISSFGFLIIAISTFLKFVPIVKTTWIGMGMGLPVMLTALVGAVLILFKNHFAAFFAVIFPAFFITHGVIIAYDTKAIALGAVSGAEGWMRSVPLIFVNAMVPSSGAFWGIIGVGIAFSALTVGWIIKIVSSNMELARKAELEYANNELDNEEPENMRDEIDCVENLDAVVLDENDNQS